MARVKFIRDEEPNIRSLETNGGAIDGALYVATDTGNMWMGTDSNALLKISNPITINLNNTTTKVTQEQYDTISASWPNVKLQVNSFVYHPSYIATGGFYFAEASNSIKTSNLSFPQVSIIYINSNLSIGKRDTSLMIADPRSNHGYGIMKSDASTIETSTNGVISVKDNGIISAKIADGAITKVKLGSDVVIPTSKADIGLENVDNTADADKSVKYATSAGSANTASVANSVAWDNITGAPTIPTPETTWKDVKTEGQFYKSNEAPSSNVVGKYDGYFYATRVYNAVYNDYAELFHCIRPIPVGHLAYAAKEGVTCAGKPKTAIGIVSDCYGHLLGGEGNPDDPNFVPIAVAGRVPLEIKGNIEIGDMVQATKNGLGKRAHRFTNRNKIIGKVAGSDPKGRNNYMEVLVGGM